MSETDVLTSMLSNLLEVMDDDDKELLLAMQKAARDFLVKYEMRKSHPYWFSQLGKPPARYLLSAMEQPIRRMERIVGQYHEGFLLLYAVVATNDAVMESAKARKEITSFLLEADLGNYSLSW